jgi:hypothetical protein
LHDVSNENGLDLTCGPKSNLILLQLFAVKKIQFISTNKPQKDNTGAGVLKEVKYIELKCEATF